MSFKSLTKEDVGKTIKVIAKIDSVYQTSGPTIFFLTDGVSKFTAKAFLRPGTRAYPEIDKNATVTAVLRIQEYEGSIEGSISSLEKVNNDQYNQQLERNRMKRLTTENVPFLVKSETLNSMRASFEKAAYTIKQAIADKRPIIIRHNADCDGYSGGVALERAILPLVKEQHTDSYNEWKFFRRLPSRAPFYPLSDAFPDMVSITNEWLKKESPSPLFIFVDSGSSEEDVAGMRRLKLLGSQIIVVNHHGFTQDHVSSIVDIHINPYLFGGDATLTASMLGVELSRLINKMDSVFLAALGGVGDKVELERIEMSQYLEHAKMSFEDLKKLSLTIDFAAYYLRSMEGRMLVSELYNNKELQVVWYEQAQKQIQQTLEVVGQNTVMTEVNNRIIGQIGLTRVSTNEFPPYGKITGLTSDRLHDVYQKPLYVLGVANDMIIFRVSKTETHFSLRELISALQKQFPSASISGGGHERAGTIRFASAREEILSFVHGWIGK